MSESVNGKLRTYLFLGVDKDTFDTLSKVAVHSHRNGFRALVVTRGSVVRKHVVKSYDGNLFEKYRRWVLSNVLDELKEKHKHTFPKPEAQERSRLRLTKLYRERERISRRLEEIKEEVYEASREVLLMYGKEGVYLEVDGHMVLHHPCYAVSKKREVVWYNRDTFALPIKVV